MIGNKFKEDCCQSLSGDNEDKSGAIQTDRRDDGKRNEAGTGAMKLRASNDIVAISAASPPPFPRTRALLDRSR